jgi:hypothetical protein
MLLLAAGVAAGALLAHAAAAPLARELHPTESRYFAATAVYAALFGAGCAVLAGLYPDWSMLYLASPAHLGRWLLVPLSLLLGFLAPLAGFVIAQRMLSRPNTRLGPGLWVLGLLLGVGLALVWGRIGVLAHFEAFHFGGPTLPLFGSEATLPVLLVLSAMVGALLAIRWHIQRHIKVSSAEA